MAVDTHTDRDLAIQKLGELIRDIEVAMLTTVDRDGSLRGRPMATQTTDFDGELWFFTQASSPKVGEVQREEQVNVAFAEPEKQHYVSLSGRARIVRDRKKAEELWSPVLKAWFPKGLDDPDLALLRVMVDKAEYWDAPSSTMVHLIGMAKALATGEPYRPGVNEKVDLDAR
jgi:general stress protein 26